MLCQRTASGDAEPSEIPAGRVTRWATALRKLETKEGREPVLDLEATAEMGDPGRKLSQNGLPSTSGVLQVV